MNYHLKNFEDAIYDFNKSIAFDQMNASSHYGLGRTYMVCSGSYGAFICLEEATKQSIALQPHLLGSKTKLKQYAILN